ncbi:MAG: dipeptidase [Bacillota bacterium]
MSYYVVDGHCDTAGLFLSEDVNYDFTKKNKTGHIDLPRLRSGGVKIQFFALYIEAEFKPSGALHRCLQLIDGYYRTAKRCRNELLTIFNLADLREAINGPKTAALLTVEGGEALENDLSVLRVLFCLGIRGLGLTWNQRNQLATGVGEGIKGDGLTSFGCEVVREMNNLGMLVDLAHINENGFYDAISLSSAPVIVSHANARAICDHPRNLSDDQLRKLSDHNGIIGLSFCPSFIHRENPSLETLLDHFVHVAEVAGIDHLGLGSDFDGIEQTVEGLDDVSCLPRLIEGLLSRGFTPQEVQKITSGNFLRMLEKVLPAEQKKREQGRM